MLLRSVTDYCSQVTPNRLRTANLLPGGYCPAVSMKSSESPMLNGFPINRTKIEPELKGLVLPQGLRNIKHYHLGNLPDPFLPLAEHENRDSISGLSARVYVPSCSKRRQFPSCSRETV